MTVTIHWRPLADTLQSFNGGTSSSFDILQQQFARTIRPDDVRTLRAMAAASNDKFYEEVADIVESVGAIEFWGEY